MFASLVSVHRLRAELATAGLKSGEGYWCLKSKRSMNRQGKRDEAQKGKNDTFIYGSLYLSILRNKQSFTILKTIGLVLGKAVLKESEWNLNDLMKYPSPQLWLFFSYICNLCSTNATIFLVIATYVLQLWLYFSYLQLHVSQMQLYLLEFAT